MFVRNLWASNTGRNPSIGWYGVFNFVNNVVFNWYHRSADGGDYRAMFNMINNYYKPGPATPAGKPVSRRILKADGSGMPDGSRRYGRVYASGNIVEGDAAVTADNWTGGIQIEGGGDTAGRTAEIRSDRPFAMPPVTVITAREAYDYVLDNAGATLPVRDIVDRRIVEEVRTGRPYYAGTLPDNAYGDMAGLADESKDAEGHFRYRRLPKDSYRKGIITDPAQMGGLPEYHGKPYTDTDCDGMPDDWEKAHGLNPRDPSDAAKDSTGDGYTNIEKYINSIGN